MPLADVGETTVLNSLLAGRYLSLHTSSPPGNEVVGGAYARQPVTFVKTSGPDPSVYKNNALIQFPVATANWGFVTNFGIWSASTGGDLLAYGAVTSAKPVDTDDTVQWEVNSLAVATD